MMKNRRKYLLMLAVTLIFVAIFGVGTALSAVRIDVNQEGSLILDYQYDGIKLSDVEFSIYRVADIEEDAELELSGDFEKYSVEINDLDDSGWKAAAETLSMYVKYDNITALQTVKTDEQGRVDFGILKTGLYLVIGQDKRGEELTYVVAPFLISLPSLNADDTWNYELTVNPKCAVKDDPPESKRTVIKVWNDDGYQTYRPENIDVSLMCNGKVYETVTLNAANYWRHAWSGLNPDDTWEVVETNVPSPYTVSYSKDGTKLTVSNSIRRPGGGGSDGGGGGGSDDPHRTTPKLDEIDDQGVPTGLLTIPDEDVPLIRLPQTGLLQWPIPILGAVGLVLFALGWRDYVGNRKEKDET